MALTNVSVCARECVSLPLWFMGVVLTGAGAIRWWWGFGSKRIFGVCVCVAELNGESIFSPSLSHRLAGRECDLGALSFFFSINSIDKRYGPLSAGLHRTRQKQGHWLSTLSRETLHSRMIVWGKYPSKQCNVCALLFKLERVKMAPFCLSVNISMPFALPHCTYNVLKSNSTRESIKPV